MELPHLPHALFNFVDLLLIHEEKAGRLAETCDLGGEQEVVDVFQRVVKLCSLVSAVLEAPKVVGCVPWSFPLVVVRDRMQGPTILTPVSGYNADDMRVWTHDDPGVARWNTPSLTVSNKAGDKIGPPIEIES